MGRLHDFKEKNMAQRRMFAKSEIRTFKFSRLSSKAQVLYFNLSLEADDEGYVEAGLIMQSINATEKEYLELYENNYVEKIDGCFLTLIVNWEENNNIPPSKMTPSKYHGMRETRTVDSKLHNGRQSAAKVQTKRSIITEEVQTNVCKKDTQVSIGKVSIDKDSTEKIREDKNREGLDNQASDLVVVGDLQSLGDLHAKLGFGVVNPSVADKLRELLETFNQDVVAHAMNLASLNNKSFGYALGILRNYKKSNLIKIDDVIAAEKQHEKQKSSYQGKKKTKPVPNWSTETEQESKPMTAEEQADFDKLRQEALDVM